MGSETSAVLRNERDGDMGAAMDSRVGMCRDAVRVEFVVFGQLSCIPRNISNPRQDGVAICGRHNRVENKVSAVGEEVQDHDVAWPPAFVIISISGIPSSLRIYLRTPTGSACIIWRIMPLGHRTTWRSRDSSELGGRPHRGK